MRCGSWFGFWLPALVALWVATGAHAAAGQLSPAVAAPDGAREIDRASADFTTYPLITAKIAQRGGIPGNIAATRTVEGTLVRRTYQLPSVGKPASVAKEYVSRLEAAGFGVLFQCADKACGATFVRASPGYRSHPNLFDSRLPKQRYLAAHRAGDSGGDLYTAVQITRNVDGIAIQQDTLRVKPRELGAISVNAAAMANALATRGRVALRGIFFDTDSARIQPESKSTLREIAKLLGGRPGMRLVVVGHTDSRGSFDYNIDLSTRRAQAVVDSLVRDYGIDRDRLKPWGVGYAAPRASNQSAVGKAKNRRVELVPW